MLRLPTAITLVVMTVPALAGGAGVPDDSNNRPMLPDTPVATSPAQTSDYDMARRLIRRKQYADAIPHLELALADRPQDTELMNDLGLAKRMTGDYDGALYYDQRALGLDPSDKSVHENLGELYLAKGDLTSAQKELSTLATLCPSGCDERSALSQSVGDYKPAGSAAAPAVTTAASPPSP